MVTTLGMLGGPSMAVVCLVQMDHLQQQYLSIDDPGGLVILHWWNDCLQWPSPVPPVLADTRAASYNVMITLSQYCVTIEFTTAR